jgi:hypothetical protein
VENTNLVSGPEQRILGNFHNMIEFNSGNILQIWCSDVETNPRYFYGWKKNNTIVH